MQPVSRSTLPGPIQSLGRRWWLAVILGLIGAIVGVAVGLSRSTRYTAEARLVVGAQDLSSFQVPGFALASQQLAADYARYVDDSSTTASDLQTALGPAQKRLLSIGASPIAGSNVVRIEAVATSRVVAVKAAQTVADDLVTITHQVRGASGRAVLRKYMALSRRTQRAEDALGRAKENLRTAGRSAVPAARRAVVSATARADSLVLQKTTLGIKYQSNQNTRPAENQLSIIRPAEISGDDRQHVAQLAGALGLLAGLLLALCLATLFERRRRRRGSRAARTG